MLAVSVDIVTDRILVLWGMVEAVQTMVVITAVGIDDCTGLDDHIPERRWRVAGVREGCFYCNPFLLSYRPVGAERANIPLVAHFVFVPVPCARRGMISFQPLVVLATFRLPRALVEMRLCKLTC